MISQYNATEPMPGPSNMALIVGKSLRIQGFIQTFHLDLRPAFVADMAGWLADGKLKWRETVRDGIDKAPAAFIGLFAFGRTINVISLAGVAFAIGMTLDNSIVVLESIERFRKQGMDRFEAALAGVRRVWRAVLASTLTTVLVFAPVMFIQQEAGQLFSDIAIAISASILASMLVAITVIPSAGARVRLVSERAGRGVTGWFGGVFKRAAVGFVGWLVRGWLRSLVTVGGIIAGAVALTVLPTPPADSPPYGEEATAKLVGDGAIGARAD